MSPSQWGVAPVKVTFVCLSRNNPIIGLVPAKLYPNIPEALSEMFDRKRRKRYGAVSIGKLLNVTFGGDNTYVHLNAVVSWCS